MKAVLAVYKHAACAQVPALVAVKPVWDALCAALSAEVDALIKTSSKSAREEAAWVPLSGWLRAEAEFAAREFGSVRHLLVALHCKWPPLRGGDLGQVHIVAPGDARATDGRTNVLVWVGEDQPAELLVQAHKTAHLKGALVRPLPLSLRKIVAASLAKAPRALLFVSPAGGAFTTEAVFTGWANREFARVFGRPTACNSARHAWCSAMDTSRMSTAQLEEVARLMGHSLAQQRAYLRLDSAAPAAALTTDAGEYAIPIRA